MPRVTVVVRRPRQIRGADNAIFQRRPGAQSERKTTDRTRAAFITIFFFYIFRSFLSPVVDGRMEKSLNVKIISRSTDRRR